MMCLPVLFSYYAWLTACSLPLALTLALASSGDGQAVNTLIRIVQTVWQLESGTTLAAPADLYFQSDYSAGSPHLKMLEGIPMLEE